MTIAIALRAARVHYGPLEALHGIDLFVPAARLTVLLGRNGSGRTTVLRALAGTVPLTSGSVLWRGTDITGTPAHVRARRGLTLVPDQGAVFGSLPVADQLSLASPDGTYAAALDAYPALRPLLPRRASTLSGGEQRMLAVARALLSPARLLLLDEPTQGMSPATAARTHALLASATAAPGPPDGAGPGRTVLLAEQSFPPSLRRAATLVYELRRGTVVFAGEPGEIERGEAQRREAPRGEAQPGEAGNGSDDKT
ncbi:ATP-binding cassette domain-containing protein [Streptomyces sp. NPDC003077]|uniref:ATP-binding cassette domain-containing protein n=1 Tax=Streptomyces sp. NPDC003077 TaxID=3154443 RepID=UPI0033A531CE